MTGDGIPDLIIGSGQGEASSVTIIDGATGDVFAQFPVLDGFTGGTFVATGDFQHTGVDDLAVVADAGGGPVVQIFSFPGGKPTLLASFFAFANTDFRGGLRVAAGDMNGDGFADLMVTYGPGGGPLLRTFNGQTLLTTQKPTLPRQLHLRPRPENGFVSRGGGFFGNGQHGISSPPRPPEALPLAIIYSGSRSGTGGASDVNAFLCWRSCIPLGRYGRSPRREFQRQGFDLCRLRPGRIVRGSCLHFASYGLRAANPG